MRVLFVSYPDKTHLQPMVPVAWALRAAGHEVVFASQPNFADVITGTGLTALPVGSDRDAYRAFDTAAFVRSMADDDADDEPSLWEGEPERVGWADALTAYDEAVTWWHKPDNFPMVGDLVAYARHWQPDLVIWEPVTYAGAIAAKACGAAHGRLMNTPDVFGRARDHFRRLLAEQPADERRDPLAAWLGGYARKYGGEFTEDMVTGHFTIDHFPDRLGMAADVDRLPVRYVPYGGAGSVPTWLWEPPRRPRVALTLGLVASDRFQGYPVDVQEILTALADLDVEVVATVARAQRHTLTTVPDNARVVPFVPLPNLLQTCTAVIHHAGAATLCTSTLAGLPQLVLPWSLSEPWMADRLAESGAALLIPSGQVTGAAVRDAVRRLLTEPSFTDRARELRADMLAQPSPNEIVDRLEQLTVKHRTR